MLLRFGSENSRSFRDPVEFSMEATRLSEPDVVRQIGAKGRTATPYSVLPCLGFYGSNASGKSNILSVMDDLRTLVIGSFRQGPDTALRRTPFLLSPRCMDAPTTYEIDVVVAGVRYEYGVAVDSHQVHQEWAYWYPKGRMARLFDRHFDEVDHGAASRSRGKATEQVLRRNALFLSTAAALGHPELGRLYQWIHRNLLLAHEGNRSPRQTFTESLLHDSVMASATLEMLRAADLGVVGIERRQAAPLDPVLAERIRKVLRVLAGDEDQSADELIEPADYVELIHSGPEGPMGLPLEFESRGTLVWIGLVGPVLQALADGSVLLVDELDASLHPHLVARLVELFQDPETNTQRAQLIFNSHDVALMGDGERRLLGRDQVWLVEKDRDGVSSLAPLARRAPRKTEAVAARYLSGHYGAVPLVGKEEFSTAVGQMALPEVR